MEGPILRCRAALPRCIGKRKPPPPRSRRVQAASVGSLPCSGSDVDHERDYVGVGAVRELGSGPDAVSARGQMREPRQPAPGRERSRSWRQVKWVVARQPKREHRREDLKRRALHVDGPAPSILRRIEPTIGAGSPVRTGAARQRLVRRMESPAVAPTGTTRRDLSSWARTLFWALLALIGFGIVALSSRSPRPHHLCRRRAGDLRRLHDLRLQPAAPRRPRRRRADCVEHLPRHLQRLPAPARPVRRQPRLAPRRTGCPAQIPSTARWPRSTTRPCGSTPSRSPWPCGSPAAGRPRAPETSQPAERTIPRSH